MPRHVREYVEEELRSYPVYLGELREAKEELAGLCDLSSSALRIVPIGSGRVSNKTAGQAQRILELQETITELERRIVKTRRGVGKLTAAAVDVLQYEYFGRVPTVTVDAEYRIHKQIVITIMAREYGLMG